MVLESHNGPGAKEAFKKTPSNLGVFIRGLIMGTVDAVPGVSGGTVAFITGIYPRLVDGINDIRNHVQTILTKPKEIKNNFKNAVKEIDWQFFLSLGFGIAIALFVFSGLMSFLLENHAANTFAFFAGLILASTFLIIKTLHQINLKNFVGMALGVIFAYVISGFTAATISNNPFVLFVSGAIAICAMILPGISGSFLLVLLGQYEYVINAIHERNIAVILTFGLGAVVGILAFSKFLKDLLKNYYQLTMYVLCGVMLGALRVPYIQISNDGGFASPLVLLALLVLSAVVVIGVDLVARKVNKKSK